MAAKYIIHTDGLIWEDERHNESVLLANCYKNSLALAEINYIESIAFPCISTGVYDFPHQLVAEIAVHNLLRCCFAKKKHGELEFHRYRLTINALPKFASIVL